MRHGCVVSIGSADRPVYGLWRCAVSVTRRQFGLMVVAGAGACGGCGLGGGPTGPLLTRQIDAGPVSAFAADGIYDQFRHQGFFLVVSGGALTAISSDCTHRDCPLHRSADSTFSCRCHGSRFDRDGNVLRGPAQRPLPHFSTHLTGDQRLIVDVTRTHFDE